MDPISHLKAEIDRLAPDLLSDTIQLKRHDFLGVPGRVDRNTYFVEEGAIRIFYQSETEEHTIRFAYQDSIFAPLYSILLNQPTQFHYQALRKTRLQVIAYPALRQFLDQQATFQGMWTKIMEQLVIDQMEREIDLITESPRERYERVLARSPRLFQEIPYKYIASYLRMSPETLSRLRNS